MRSARSGDGLSPRYQRLDRLPEVGRVADPYPPEKLAPADVLLCSVVKAELLHGAQKYGNRERRLRILAETFAPYASLPFDDTAAAAYANIRHELESAGNVIGPNDLMIAAIAQANILTLVTHNTAEFGRVPSLQVEDWQT